MITLKSSESCLNKNVSVDPMKNVASFVLVLTLIFFEGMFSLKPIFHMATSFAQREAKTRIGQRDWLKLAGEKIRREAFLLFCLFARIKWKIGLSLLSFINL